MRLRDKAVYATSALLYSGPLYSGLAGFGLSTIPLFAVIFALWLFVVRPGDWPRFAEDWKHPRTLAWPILIFAVQMVLVAFCLAVGRSIGALFDFRPPLPLAFTVLMSMLAIALARLAQRPDRLPPRRVPGERLGIGAGILDVGRPEMPGKSAKMELVDQVMSAIAPGDGTTTTMRATMLPTAAQIEAAGVARNVIDALDAVEQRTDVLTLQGMVAFRPGVARDLAGSDVIARLMEKVLASGNTNLIEATAVAAVTLLTEAPETADQFPPPARVRQAAATLAAADPGAERALLRLAQVLGSLIR
ncbi:MAG: hypothetical protein MUE98_12785 [Rhodobacteraceae bacterium]|jgi:hypothetical protein|nr:hypothetical protein [Paracoccaceae bacterium]